MDPHSSQLGQAGPTSVAPRSKPTASDVGSPASRGRPPLARSRADHPDKSAALLVALSGARRLRKFLALVSWRLLHTTTHNRRTGRRTGSWPGYGRRPG